MMFRIDGSSKNKHLGMETTQPVITCSKLTIKTLEQGVNFEHM